MNIKMNRNHPKNTVAFFLYLSIILLLCMEIILNLTPPISRDALIHHLAVPKLWLKHGGIYEIPWANYAYYPMNIDLLYVLCLYLNNDIAPKFIHLVFGLGTGLLIYAYIKAKFDRNWGLLGILIFISTPIVIWLSTSAYVDLGMTFFTTASVLSFIKWRNSAYKDIKWFFISSFGMGIAVGSKYNALIALFIINMLLILCHARDTRRQMLSLRYGVLFFVVTALVASPWYLKNYLQTGNPFYPLFDTFINSLHHHSIQQSFYQQAVEKTGRVSFFKMREIMYGESLWETLLIPIRMFFQGKDTGYQYFQGSLNPILIVFLPFAFLNKRYGKDKIFFLSFTVIFIFMAYFLTAKQVRYILPVIPFLSIFAVMGVKSVMDKTKDETFLSSLQLGEKIKKIARVLLIIVSVILLIFNWVYLKNRIKIIQPFPYVMGKETREAFLRRHLLHYDTVEYINNNLPMDAQIFTIFLGQRGYYLDRAYQNESSFGMNTLQNLIDSSSDENKFKEYLRSMGITHILMRNDLFEKFLRDNYSKEKIEHFLKLFYKNWLKLYENKAHSVWVIYDKQQR